MKLKNFFGVLVVGALVAASLIVIQTVQAADNLIPNPSVESAVNNFPTDWHKGYIWGDLDAQYQYVDAGYQSNKALRTTITRYSTGDAKWYFTPQPVTAGQIYQFSDYYISDTTSHIIVMVEHNDGSITYSQLPPAIPAPSWERYSSNFTAPLTAKLVSVFHLISSVGTLTTDTFSLSAQTSNSSTFNRALVSVTFDDGWQSTHQNALPILEQNNIKSTQYIVTGFVNSPNYMTLAEIRDFHQRGHQVASHTVHHYDLTTLGRKKLISELTQSKLYLERNIGATVSDIAAPYGAYNNTTITQVKKYYRSQRTSDVGFNTKSGFDSYRLRSQHITPSTTIEEFRNWINTAVTEKSWLILMYHNVDSSGSAYSVTPEMLNTQLAAIQEVGITSKTVNQALNELLPQL